MLKTKEKEMPMMKIMHFINDMSTGGAETLVKNYMLHFNREKFDIVLLCMAHKYDSPYERLLMKSGVRMIFVNDYLLPEQRGGRFVHWLNHFLRYCVVRKIIHKESPDILHTHLPINNYIKWSAPNRNTVIIHTVHNEPSKLWFSGKKGRKKDYKAVKWLVKKYDMRLIVLHERMKKEVDELFGSNSFIVNNGVEVERFKDVRFNKQTKKALGIPSKSFVVGHIGRFAPEKNHDYLIEVFEAIKEKKKDAYLLMVGDGARKHDIIARLHKKHLDGSFLIVSNRSDIPDLMSIMDVFVFPSLYEGLPVVLVEAQEARLPCFISDSISTHVVISNIITRLSLASGVHEWANQILRYRRPHDIWLEDEEWNIDTITKKLEDLYLNLVAEKRHGEK